MVMPCKPASLRAFAFCGKNHPFVVISSLFRPSIWAIRLMRFSIFSRKRGSPPVSFIFSIPSRCTKILLILSISANVKMSLFGIQCTFSFLAGIQNKHEKLHLSVTDILNFFAILPLPSSKDVVLEEDASKSRQLLLLLDSSGMLLIVL